MSTSEPAERWRRALEAWALPEEIVRVAPESPWIHPPVLFEVPEEIEPSPSHERAREVLSAGDTVLDVGCGGGVAAFALTPPASRVIGVDQQPAMLAMFAANAARRGVACETVEGLWPAVAAQTPRAHVVTAHHVVYNVADIVPFLRALDDHARRRVVIEMPDRHPLAPMSGAWRHFWNLERPDGPTPNDLLDVLAAMGIDARRERFEGPLRSERDLEQSAHFMRIRLCLPEEREPEVLEYLSVHGVPGSRELSSIWWDVASHGGE